MLNETNAICCACGKTFKTVSEHVTKHYGYVYCAQCRAEKGYVDGFAELPWNKRKRVWVVECLDDLAIHASNSWIEAIFSSEAGARKYVTQTLHAHSVTTDVGEEYVLDTDDEDWLSSEEFEHPLRYHIRCEDVYE